jgi:ATP-dependent Clp protease ATP-binding subunit ClpC
MPPELKEKKTEIDKLAPKRKQPGRRATTNAARFKADRMRAGRRIGRRDCDAGVREAGLDEIVDAATLPIVSAWTGIPVNSMLQTEAEKLLHMEDHLHERIVGQEQAIAAVSDAIRRSAQRVERPQAPHRLLPLSWGRPAWARRKWPRRWPSSCSTTKTRCCAST